MDSLNARYCVHCRWLHTYILCPRCGNGDYILVMDMIKILAPVHLDKLLIRKENECLVTKE